MEILLVLVSALALSFIFSEIASYFKYPKIIGQILAGVVIGLPFMRTILPLEGSMDIINLLAELGIVFLMLLVGLEADYQKLKSLSKPSTLLATFSMILSFVFAAVVTLYFGYGLIVALVVGTALAVSAELITAKLLIELNKLKTRAGEILIGAGLIDDILGMFFLSILILIINEKSAKSILFFPLEVLSFVVIMFVLFKLISRAMVFLQREPTESFFEVMMILTLAIAYLSEFMGIGIVIGAFVAGLILQISIKDVHLEKKMVSDIKDIAFAFFVPFFFVIVGLNLNILDIFTNWILVSVLLTVAIAGKMLAAYSLKPIFPKVSWKSLTLLGAGMNSRGIFGLVILLIAKNEGIIPQELFSAIVIISIITSIMFAVVANKYKNKSAIWSVKGIS
jgi:Kef-type K+ transport system membrane component KefB